ncbi:hypothetical protein STSP2_03388 [Anaerohalosphaera lusitana]|uniref:Uncharacterized protein n=1 Tax=Anaerohalosphaera lusitana TaxID=1936003 RepID=A0A1U9NQH3_9BACT|nr:hypothetical protein [Anaerohalosphaera lusitana]AQT70183.1 hypothetical protein STSP2_03388 [Anaerohalosphaera lusitana]
MNDRESQLNELFDKISDEPSGRAKHKEALRSEMLERFEPAAIRLRPRERFHKRAKRAILSPATAGLAACVLALLIGHQLATRFVWDTEPAPSLDSAGGVSLKYDFMPSARLKEAETEVGYEDSVDSENGRLEEMLQSKDIDGLVEILQNGSFGDKIAAAKLLSDMGAQEALPELERLGSEWQGGEPNPFSTAAEVIKSSTFDPTSTR